MEHIELHDLDKFNDYLREYENNICGKHCLAILLHVHTNTIYSVLQVVKILI